MSNANNLDKKYLPTITQLTHITKSSAAIINHFQTKNITKQTESFILLNDLTNHLPKIASTNSHFEKF